MVLLYVLLIVIFDSIFWTVFLKIANYRCEGGKGQNWSNNGQKMAKKLLMPFMD